MALTSIARDLEKLKGWNSVIAHVQKIGTTRINVKTESRTEALPNIQFLNSPIRIASAIKDPVAELSHIDSGQCSQACFVHRYIDLTIVKPKIIEVHHFKATGDNEDPHLFTILPVDTRVSYVIRLLFPVIAEAKQSRVVGRATIIENKEKNIGNYIMTVKQVESLDHIPGIGSLYR